MIGKKTFLALSLMVLTFEGSARADRRVTKDYDFASNGIYYRILSSSTVAVTAKQYSYMFVTPEDDPDYFDYFRYESGYTGKVVIPQTVTHSGIAYTVTEIDEYAFRNGSYDLDGGGNYTCDITEISIPKTVSRLNNGTFYYCPRLETVSVSWATPITISPSYLFFQPSCSSLTLRVPDGSLDAYRNAQGWNNFKQIEEQAININFADDAVKSICVSNWDADGDGELSKDEAAAVTNLGSVFSNNTEITSFDELKYFTGLTSLYSSFSGCSNLSSITLPESLTSIGDIKNCSSI